MSAERLDSALTRLMNLATAKQLFVERMEKSARLTVDPWQIKHTRQLVEVMRAEIIEIRAAANDIRRFQENA